MNFSELHCVHNITRSWKGTRQIQKFIENLFLFIFKFSGTDDSLTFISEMFDDHEHCSNN